MLLKAEQLTEAETLEKLSKQGYEIQCTEIDKDFFKYKISKADLFKIYIYDNLYTETIQNNLVIYITNDQISMFSYIDNTLATTIHTIKEQELHFSNTV